MAGSGKLLRVLVGRQAGRPGGGAAGYGCVAAAIGGASLLRLVAPLDVAPFLLYLPLVFLLSLAFGWGPGLLGVVLTDVLAAYFFLHDGIGVGFSAGQVVALVQFVVVGAAMVAICEALRRAMVENQSSLVRLEQGATLLRAAKAEAETAMQAAEEANRAKSAFLANMSHELRTPLSAVIGYSEMMEEEAEELGQDGLLADLGKIKSNAKHLLTLINDVLDLSKVEANKMDVLAEDAEVEPFLADVASAVDALVRRKNNELVVDAEPGLGAMRTDVVKLRQCLFNLLSNASKFTEGGRITLRAARERGPGEDWLVFTVSDTGIGMTEEQLGRLFQRFSQADETTTRRFGGTGLGLALSRAFAQLLGGDIAVESEPGRGTWFTLRVPAVLRVAAEAAVPAMPEAAGSEAAGSELVLVIDDDPAQQDLMTRFLRRQGYAVQVAASGRAGLEAARTARPHAILLDVMMPEMDGWAVLRELKADPDTAAIPVVMVSFVAEAGLGASLGAADVLPKPVNWGRLKETFERLDGSPGEALVVDDDPDARERLRRGLEREGWTVQEAANGAEAIARVEATVPRVVLLDLTMPVMDGFRFLHRLRAMPGGADVPVVVLSARDLSPGLLSEGERAALATADAVLGKGTVSIHDLSETMHKLERP